MTRDDAIDVLRVLTAAWPNANVGDDTVELWIQYLATIEGGEGHRIAANLVVTNEWMPTIARFQEAVAADRRMARMRQDRELPTVGEVTPPEVARLRVADLRRALRDGPS